VNDDEALEEWMKTACFAPKARELGALSLPTVSSLENRSRGTLVAFPPLFPRDCCFGYS